MEIKVNKLMSENWNRMSDLNKSNKTEDEQLEMDVRRHIQNSAHTWTSEEIIEMFKWLDEQLNKKENKNE